MRRITLCVAIAFSAANLAGCAGTPMNTAARAGRVAEVRAMLDKGADVNAYGRKEINNPYILRPLHSAVLSENIEMVKLLLDRGADVNARIRDTRGGESYTPLGYAMGYRLMDKSGVEIAQLLVDRGADCNATYVNSTIFERAVEDPLLFGAIAQACVKRGANVDAALDRLELLGPKFAPSVAYLKKISGRRLAQDPAAGPAAAAVEVPKALSSDIDKPSYRLPERPDDFALVVGIGKYSDIPEAQFAQRDAEAVREHLIAGGFPSRNVIELLGEKAGRSSMEKFLETWLPRNVNENSRVFFYFSGHGAPDPKTGEAYLLPWDADAGFLENTGYPIKRLYEKLGALKVKEVVVAMDACFSGAGGRSVLAKGARPLVTTVAVAGVPKNLTVFAAAGGDQITSTLESEGHGTFTYYFLKGLGGGAKDDSGTVTAKGLYDYLKPKVQDAARRQNRDQAPVLHAQDDRKLVRF